jgi:TPR repeat protein
VLVLIGGAATAFLLLQPKHEDVAVVTEPAAPALSPQQKFEEAERAEQAGQCANASELMHAAADEGSVDADLKLGESYDPSGDAARIGCLAQDWNILLALTHYSRACTAGNAAAPERVTRLEAWIETTAKIGDGSSLELQAQMAQSSVPAAKTACGLQ